MKNMLIDQTSPLLKLVTWKQIRASLNHRKVMNVEPSPLIPRNVTNLQ